MATSLSINIQHLVNWLTYAPLAETEAIRTLLIARMTALAVGEDASPVTAPNSAPYPYTINQKGITDWIASADADDAIPLQSLRAAIELRWDAAQYS